MNRLRALVLKPPITQRKAGPVASRQLFRRAALIGAFAVAAAAAPAFAVLSEPDAATQQAQGGQCLAWFGSKVDGKCIAWAMNGQIGPSMTFNGPSTGSPGLSPGPMLPGQSINTPVGGGN